ncbi:MAG: hypothetical protein ACPG9R_14710 [Marinobacter salsuginis]
MAVTEQERRAMNRRKMAIQAGIDAKRSSLMNLSAARYNAMAQRPMTVQSTPVYSSSNFAMNLSPLPGRDIVDANNSAAINLARQNPGVNLTDELNRRAAAQTVEDLRQVKPEVSYTNVQDINPVGSAMEVAAPTEPTPAPAVEPTPFNYGPGLTPARAEELYGPGGMYGTTPLPGGAYEQMGVSPTTFPSGGSTTAPGSATALAAPRSATDNLTDAIKKIKKRAAIIRGTAALVGGDASAADRYEAEAMASLGVYAGQYAMSQLTPADFKDKQTLFQSLLAKGMPLDQILQVLESGVADVPDPTKLKDQQKQVFVDSEGNEHAGKLAWDADGNLQYLTRGGNPAPADWIPRAGQGTTVEANLQLSGEKPDVAMKKTMIDMARARMEEAEEFWLDENGKLREERTFLDSLGWREGARTTKQKMERALSLALRLESGAAIGDDERAQFYALFMPNASDWVTGDRENAIREKFQDFNEYITAIIELINPNMDDDAKRAIFRDVLAQAKSQKLTEDEVGQVLDMD